MRIGVALVQQETNTFSVQETRIEAFTIRHGTSAGLHTRGTNSEMSGAIDAIEAAGHDAVPLLYAWALPSGLVTAAAFERVRALLTDAVASAPGLDGLVLALHGSMASEDCHDADAVLIETARAAIGDAPVAVSLDLHANVTQRMVGAVDAIAGYHTDPHTDMDAAGARAAHQLLGILDGSLEPAIALAKRPMIVPAESMNTTSGPLAPVRKDADREAAVDISLFPAQPWLDVPELGFGVVVTTNGDRGRAEELANTYAERVWSDRASFEVPRFLNPAAAIAAARQTTTRPFLVAESADAPSAGAAGDSPAMLGALLRDGEGLTAAIPIVDPESVATCHDAGNGAKVELRIGSAIDGRWHEPVPLRGSVRGLGEGTYLLEGAGYTGLEVDMGRFAVVERDGISILLTERPVLSADPATFLFAGIDPNRVDVLVVRSCSDFRPNFPEAAPDAVTLDVPGTATPRLENLEFRNVDRPLWPLDRFPDDR